MARNKKQNTSGAQPAGFVPASLDKAHGSHLGSSSGDFSQTGPNHGSISVSQYSRNSVNYAGRRPVKKAPVGKIVLAIVIIALIAGIVGLGVYIYKEQQKQAINEDLHSMSRDVMQAIDNELTGMKTFDQPFTVLLLGSDERSWDTSETGARTDTIVLCRVDPTQNILSMVSIPRDTKIELAGVGTTKINSAYTYGGPGGTIAAVKELCGVEIDHYAEINFEGLMSLIDAIGGIDVYVDETIDDPDAGDIVIPAGQQHLDGAQALVFSRSRAYADGDFTRVSNQRKVIEAIVHRGLEAPASELYGIIEASTEFLSTDSAMDVDFIYSLADQIRHNNDYPVQLFSATIPATTAMISEVSYVIADQAGVNEMMKVFSAGGDVSTVAGSGASVASELSEVGSSSAGAAADYSTDYSVNANAGYATGYNTTYSADSGTGNSTGYVETETYVANGYDASAGTDTGAGYDAGVGYGTGTGYNTSADGGANANGNANTANGNAA